MREYTLRTDGLCNTITTVVKDNYIVIGAAMRGRYNSNGKTEQKIEVRDDELSNAITTVQKDSLVVIKRQQKKCFNDILSNKNRISRQEEEVWSTTKVYFTPIKNENSNY